MNRLSILLVFFTFLSHAQNKTITSDTTNYYYKWNNKFIKELELGDFKQSTKEFCFRFRNRNQTIEITKDSTEIKAILINHITHSRRSQKYKRKLISEKTAINSKTAQKILDLIETFGILEIPTDSEIEGWSDWADTLEYFLEYSDRNSYHFKRYNAISNQDSIPAADTLLKFIERLEQLLSLKQSYSDFKAELPRKGCYGSTGTVTVCYLSNSVELGYSGASKLPLGFRSSYATRYIGNLKVNFGTTLQYNFDNDDHYHLNFKFSKWRLFFNDGSLYDLLGYNFQKRRLNINSTNNKFENHQLSYGLNIGNGFIFKIGTDILTQNRNSIGPHLYASKWLSNYHLNSSFSASIIDGAFNYKISLKKTLVQFNSSIINSLDIGLSYEKFFNYRDLYFDLSLSI